ncbi:hypothetical protein BSBH6_02194 [Bacillus subtilis]|nr:hypothetical protein BSBH6_02194 [Bacillus subtilis]RPK25084.1 hypothetical protein BH5_01915 [Bacillus subtilis]
MHLFMFCGVINITINLKVSFKARGFLKKTSFQLAEFQMRTFL